MNSSGFSALTATIAAASSNEFEVAWTDAEWRSPLTAELYAALRKSSTERPYTNQLNDEVAAFRLEFAELCKNHEIAALLGRLDGVPTGVGDACRVEVAGERSRSEILADETPPAACQVAEAPAGAARSYVARNSSAQPATRAPSAAQRRANCASRAWTTKLAAP